MSIELSCFCFFRMNAISDEGPGLLAPDPGDFLHGQKVTKKPPRGLCPLWTPPLLLGRRGPGVRSTTRWCPSSELLRAPLARLAECYSPPAGPPCRTPCRTAQRMRHAYRTRRAVSPAPCRWPGSVEMNRALGGEPNEEDRRSRELWRRFDCHRPREVVGKMETARS